MCRVYILKISQGPSSQFTESTFQEASYLSRTCQLHPGLPTVGLMGPPGNSVTCSQCSCLIKF